MLKYHIRPLPYWVLTDLQPAFYDSESGSVLQQTSRVYAKLQEVLKYYNDFTREVNRYIDEFETGIIKDFECFKNCITKTMADYITSIDMKVNIQDSTIAEAIERQDKVISDKFEEQDTAIAEAIERQDKVISDKFEEQDTAIANAINYMKDNIIATTENIINQAIASGDLNIGITYEEPTESLNIIVTREGE